MENFLDALGKEDRLEYARLSKQSMELTEQITKCHAEQLVLVRKGALKKGILAKDLVELKSRSGKPFEAKKTSNSEEPVVAFAGTGWGAEKAYLCCSRNVLGVIDPDPEQGCGWVQGEPGSEEYNDISFLSGSAGINFHCRICGMKVGKIVTMRS